MQVLCKYVDLWEKLNDVVLQPSIADRFVWRWTDSGHYTASSAYRSFFVGRTTLLGAKELWKACAPPKVKFFIWLAIHGRLWAAERRKRHGLQDDDACALCGQLQFLKPRIISSSPVSMHVRYGGGRCITSTCNTLLRLRMPSCEIGGVRGAGRRPRRRQRGDDCGCHMRELIEAVKI